jgi:hypothetical protein
MTKVQVVELVGGPCDGQSVTFRVADLYVADGKIVVSPRDVTRNPLASEAFVAYALTTDLDCDVEQFAEFVCP